MTSRDASSRTAFGEDESGKSRANARQGKRETVSRSRCREAAIPEQETSPCSTSDLDLDVTTNEELLAEIGLDSYTIRRIRAEAGEEEKLFLG